MVNETFEQQEKDGDDDMSDDTGLLMKYFVLKPSGNSAYSRASRAAMRAYAEAIQSENPRLSGELVAWVTELDSKKNTSSQF